MNRIIKAVLFLLISGGILFMLYTSKKSSLPINLEKAAEIKGIVPVVVLGSGPAGLSAALYAARSGLYTVVFQGKKPGGQLTETTYVENWPGTPKLLGSQLIEQNRKQAEKFGALMVPDSIVSADLSQWPFLLKTEEGTPIYALSVIIATGSNPRKLNQNRNVPGENEYWGYGVTTCAVCDAPFYKDKKVVVVGGGDSAVEEATLLTAYASKVYVLVRGSAMRAAKTMQARLKGSDKIEVLYNTEITEIMGDGTAVKGVKIINMKDKKAGELAVDGVFLAIGHIPNSEIVKKYLQTDSEGYIILPARSQKTSVPGVFAAGDVADHVYRQAGVAAGDGIKAALDALAFLQEHGYNEALSKKLEKNYWFPHPEAVNTPLPVINTGKEFDKLAKENNALVIEVGAEHCASCQALIPIMQSVAAQMHGKAYFAQIDTGKEPKELIKRFDIKGIPVILVFKKGKLIARYDQQVFTKRELNAILNQLIGDNS